MERNIILDYFKVILSMLVITIHSQPLFAENSSIGWLISNGIARIAVPCFFIISGYYIYSKIESKKAFSKYIYHLLIVYAVWSLIYLPTYVSDVDPKSLITFALMGYYHLWFLPALIIGILILRGLKKTVKHDTIIIVVAITLFIIGYVMELYDLKFRIYRNGLFFGFPFVALGYYIHKLNIVDRSKDKVLYPILIAGLILLFIESYSGYKSTAYHNFLISLPFVCSAIFILLVKHPTVKTEKYDISKLAASIYYVHILVLVVLFPRGESYNIYNYPLIVVISIILSIFIILINKRVKILL